MKQITKEPEVLPASNEVPREETNHKTGTEEAEEVLEPKKALEVAMVKNLRPEDIQLYRQSLNKIVQDAEIVIKDLSEVLKKNGTTIRRVVNDYIFTDINPQTGAQIEVLFIQDLQYILKKTFPEIIVEDDEDIIEFIFENRNIAKKVVVEDMCQVLKSFGVREDIPKSKKYLNYNKLDLKSKRIINRFSNYLAVNQIHLMTFFDDIKEEKLVKTATSSEKRELVEAKKFFNKLHLLGLKKKPSIYENLCEFLCIGENY